MKAMEIPGLVKVFIAAIVTLVVLLGLYSYGKELYEKGTLENMKFTSYKPYVFNITNLLTDNDAFTAAQQDNYLIGGVDPQFCKDLRNCIEMNIKGGKRCEIVYKVRPGTPFDPQRIADALAGSCTTRDVKEELYKGTGRKLCKMKPVTTYNKLKENDMRLLDYEPYLHNCYLPTSLGTHNVLGDVNSMNYIYSGRGTANGYSFENGGMVRIVVTNVSVMNDFDASCSYSVYVCGQNAIADTVDETSVQVFKTIQTIDDKEIRDFYFNETIYWGGATPKMPDGLTVDATTLFLSPMMWFFMNLLNLGGVTKPTINNLYGFNPRNYEFTIGGACIARGTCREALIDAVDAGMWEWNKVNYESKKKTRYFEEVEPDARYVYFSYPPFENIVDDNTINFDSGCWKSDFETSNAYERLDIDGPTFENSDNLKHNFNLNNFDDFNEGERIKMTLGIKKMFIIDDEFTAKITLCVPFTAICAVIWQSTYSLTEDIRTAPDPDLERFDPRVILVMDPITFCKESGGSLPPPPPPPGPVCPNDILETGEQCDMNQFGGQTCIGLGFDAGTLGCTGVCTFDTSGCTDCGNNVREGTEQCDGTDAAACPGLCLADCTCSSPPLPICGNNAREGTEECDGTDLGGQTCISKGFISGTLGCTGTCTFDTSGCCSCPSSWTNAGCGGGTCSSWQIRSIRTCNPAGCGIEESCTDSDSCCDTACGAWTDDYCSSDTSGACSCLFSGIMYQKRTCPAGALICSTTLCIPHGPPCYPC